MYFIDTVQAEETTHESVVTNTDTGLLSSFGVNGPLFFFQLVNFAIVFIILWFLILKPLARKLAERQKIVEKTLDDSKKMEETLKKSEEDYQARLRETKVEANYILENARKESEVAGNLMKEKVKSEITGLVEHARNMVKEEKEQTIRELRLETTNLLALALEKMTGEKIDEKKHLEDVLNKLK